MKPTTALVWARIFLALSAISFIFFGVNVAYAAYLGIALFQPETAAFWAIVSCIIFWVSMYANELIGKRSMKLDNCAIVSSHGVERWIRQPVRIWNADTTPGQFIVPRVTHTSTVTAGYHIGKHKLYFVMEIEAHHESDSTLSRFAPLITGSNQIAHDIREAVAEALFESLKSEKSKFEPFSDDRSPGQQEAFNQTVKHMLEHCLEKIGLRLKSASFKITS